MSARFERDVEVGAASGISRHAERFGLGVRPAGRLGAPLADDAAVAYEHRADGRVGAGIPNRLAGEFDSPQHVIRGARPHPVHSCQRGSKSIWMRLAVGSC